MIQNTVLVTRSIFTPTQTVREGQKPAFCTSIKGKPAHCVVTCNLPMWILAGADEVAEGILWWKFFKHILDTKPPSPLENKSSTGKGYFDVLLFSQTRNTFSPTIFCTAVLA